MAKEIIKQLLHIGVPTTQSKPGEVWHEGSKLFMAGPETNGFKFEYLRFMDGTYFPEIMHRQPHVAVKVDSIDEAAEGAEMIVKPIDCGNGVRIAFIVKDGVILELVEG